MKKLSNNFPANLFNPRLFPLFLLILTFLTYGILIPFIGFYWDDFPYTWFTHIGGANSVFRAVAADRPVLGLLYGFTLPLVGDNPLLWQLLAIFTHWLCAYMVFLLIREIWPSHEEEASWVAILFLVFPGFSQNWIAVIYSQLFFLFTLFFVSLLLMVHSLKNFKHYWLFTLISIFLSLFSMASSEYTVGLELLRPFIILIILKTGTFNKSDRLPIFTVFNRWLPYLASLIVFGIYRVFLASSVLYSVRITGDFFTNPIGLAIYFIKSCINNLFNAGLMSWVKPFLNLTTLNLNHWIDRFYLIIIFTSAIWIYVFGKFFIRNAPDRKIESDRKMSTSLILFGILSIILAGIPFFAVKYELLLSFPYDRLVLPMMIGSCLLLLGFIRLVFRSSKNRNIFFITLVAFSIGSQFLNANQFREDWENLREFFWQMQWRVPDMKSGTMLLTDTLPLSYYSDNSLTAPLNWIYPKSIENDRLPFILNFLSVRLGNRVPNLNPNTPIDQYYRILNFVGNTSNSLVLQYSPPGCLHIFDPILDAYNPGVAKEMSQAIKLSNFSRIIAKPETTTTNPKFLLGNEPAHNWCFYYEKAALALQTNDWNTITELGKEAFSLNDYPNDPIERFPFLEAYAHTGDFERALEISRKTIQISIQYSMMLCKLWDRIEKSADVQSLPNNIQDFLSNSVSCG